MWLWGAAAGAAGTAVIRGLMMASQRFAPETLPPMKEDPGHYMVKKVKNALPEKVRERVPDKVEETAAAMLAFGYGMTFGSLYAVARRQRGILLEGRCWAP